MFGKACRSKHNCAHSIHVRLPCLAAPDKILHVGNCPKAELPREKFCYRWLHRRLLRRYRPQSAVNCSTLWEQTTGSQPSTSQVSLENVPVVLSIIVTTQNVVLCLPAQGQNSPKKCSLSLGCQGDKPWDFNLSAHFNDKRNRPCGSCTMWVSFQTGGVQSPVMCMGPKRWRMKVSKKKKKKKKGNLQKARFVWYCLQFSMKKSIF